MSDPIKIRMWKVGTRKLVLDSWPLEMPSVFPGARCIQEYIGPERGDPTSLLGFETAAHREAWIKAATAWVEQHNATLARPGSGWRDANEKPSPGVNVVGEIDGGETVREFGHVRWSPTDCEWFLLHDRTKRVVRVIRWTDMPMQCPSPAVTVAEWPS